MTWPERIRGAIIALFGSRLVLQLRAEIEDLKTQRDYFRTRAERLELISLAPKTREQTPAIRPDVAVITGRKTWKQIQEDHAEQHRREMAEVAAKKAKEQN